LKTFRAVACLLLVLLTALLSAGQSKNEDKPLPTIADKTAKLRKLPGYFNLYWDDRQGKLWLEIDKWDTEFLFLDSLPAGIGSNDIGLDRGQMGEGRVVKFRRIGPKVLLTESNYGFRASSQNAAERRAVEDAFAQSVLWGGEVAAEENGHALVDATTFFLADAHGVADTLKKTKQGTFKLDPARSAIYLAKTKNFPENTEVESTLTFAGEDPGKFVKEVTPDPKAITVREHYSLVKLPDDNYRKRAFDPRSGFAGIDYMDFSVPAGESVNQRFITRHRLQKKDPSAAISEPVKPIIYYLDPGTPEPIRSALLEGAGWWNQAFEAAGYKNAFRVEMLPADADPMDIRYNVIEWVHRSTRGWSYGASVVDPRTGEIIKGHVLLGSLRFRQDYMILEGLLSPYAKGKPTDPRILATVLARLRQLAAHEVGHTLGLMHNYISSAQGRTSVMDYPHPLITLSADGSLDLSHAYATGIGEWDKVTIQYGYSDFPQGTDEHAALNDILQKALARGLSFLSDQDARPAGSAHPQVHLWDNGKNAVDELDRVLAVRANALNRFSENAIQEGRSMARLGDVLVPVYLYHRYQTEAAAKEIGGLTYTYALRGDGQTPTSPVPAAEQRRALAAVLRTISPQVLDIPDRIANAIPPHPAGVPATRESFRSRTGLTFDPLGAAESAANHTVTLLLDPQRAARLVEYHSLDPQQLGLGEVIDGLIDASWKAKAVTARSAAVQRTVADVVLTDLLALAKNEKADSEVRAMASFKLSTLGEWAAQQFDAAGDEQERAHLLSAARIIRNYEQQPQPVNPTEPLAPPPGQPIGSADEEW
jgi:hypothetical protein